jgi:hypothetical protein
MMKTNHQAMHPNRGLVMTKLHKNKLSLSALLNYFILLIGCICATSSFAANLTASVDRATIGLEDTFVLSLRYDEQINATPDYELLRKDFDILNVQSGTQMSIVNGSMEASTQWNIALAPKKIGKALVPSFNINGAVSDAIEMTIEGRSPNQAQANEDITVVTEFDSDSVFVQQQLLMTVRLYTTVSLTGAELQPPELKDALVVKLDEKQFQTTVRGRPGAVIETRFAIYPQQSSTLNIPSLLYQVAVDSGARSHWNDPFGRSSNKVLRYRTDEKNVEVKAVPHYADASNWMPAKNLQVKEHWNLDLDNLKVGEPVSRSITITAEGLTAAQINPLSDYKINNLTFYQDQAQSEDQKNEQGVTGTRIETTAIVPTQAGKFDLPAVEIHWWNTNTQAMETTKLPAVTLNVSGSSLLANSQTPNSYAGEIPTEGSGLTGTNPSVIEKTPLWLYATNLISLLLALLFAWHSWRAKQTLNSLLQAEQQKATIYAQKESAAWHRFRKGLAEHNPAQLRNHIILWAQAYWNKPELSNLSAIAAHLPARLNELLQELDKAIYSASKQDFNSDELFQLLSNFRREKNKRQDDIAELQPLYKQD